MLILISLLKETDSPDEDKSLMDSKALLPVLIDFFQKHPLINPKTFSGDALITIEIAKALLMISALKAFIPLRTKLSAEENGYTLLTKMVFLAVPHDSTLPMKREVE